MSKKDKLIKKIKAKSKDITIEEVETLLHSFDFRKFTKGKTSGSSMKFKKGDVVINIHRPHPRNYLLDYQVNEIIIALEKEGLI